MKEGDLMHVCEMVCDVDRVNQEPTCSIISSTARGGLQMKLTGVTNERKWLETAGGVKLWSLLLQGATGVN